MAFQRKLNIVVPYRDRAEHLRAFVPHMQAYFARDKIDFQIPYSSIIVEQAPGAPFNRGMVKNIGFVLGKSNSAYTCFHDVDYLPLWTDYRWVDRPTALVWYGAERRPIRAGWTSFVEHNLHNFFGGAILVPNDCFERMNGYANGYWGWGSEDLDLVKRAKRLETNFERRKGTYLALPHDHDGYHPDGHPNEIAETNRRILNERWGEDGGMQDGLTTLAYRILNEQLLPNQESDAVWRLVTVQLTQ